MDSPGETEITGRNLLRALLVGFVRIWQWSFSSWLAPTCRYLPSCSDYAVQAIQQHGAWQGGWLAARRLMRCHPFGGSGIDEVPDSIHSTHCACGQSRRHTESRA